MQSKFVSTVILTLLLAAGNVSGAPSPLVRNYSKNLYGAGSQNWDIVQSHSGILYFANDNGILDYDSKQWTLRRNPDGISTRSLFYDNENEVLYYGCYNTLRRLSVDKNHLLADDLLVNGNDHDIREIWQVEACREGVFFRDEWNVYRYDGTSIEKYHFSGMVDAMASFGEGMAVYIRDEGLMIFRDNKFVPSDNASSIPGEKVCSLLPYQGMPLIVTERSGLWLYDNQTIHRISTAFDSEILHQVVICAAIDKEKIALGTVSSGVFLFDFSTGEATHLDSSNGLQNNTVLSICFDSSGDLWLGLDRGIDQVYLSSPEQQLLPIQNDIGAGYASEFFEGKLYLGTNQGLFTMESSGEVRPVEQVREQVWDLTVIDNRLYCCTDKGLYIFRTGKSARFIPINGVWRVIPLQRHPGLILGATYDQMFVLECPPGAEPRFGAYVSGFNDSSRVFEEDPNGEIWLSHWQKGLFRLTLSADGRRFSPVVPFSSAQGFPTHHNNIPNKLDGRIVFTTDQGFYRYDFLSQSVVPVPEMNIMFRTMPPALRVFDLSGGIRYYSSGTRQIVEYQNPAGKILRDTVSLQYLCKKRKLGFDHIRLLPPDRILINTEEGFSVLRLDRIRENSERKGFAPLIRHVYLTGAADSLVFSSFCQSHSPHPLVLSPKNNSLRFEFASPSFGLDDEWDKTCYMLENYDKNGWMTHLAGSRAKEYTKLQPGKYVFRIRNSFGESSIPVIVSPPWYETTLAYFAYALAALVLLSAATLAVDRISKKRAEKKARQIEETRLKQQMKKDLEEKANDLAASTLEVLHKNEIIRKIHNSLNDLTPYLSGDKDGEQILQTLRVSIQMGIEDNDVWKRFQSNFDIVHSGFLSQLEKQFPELNQTERRICVYLKMGLRSKEMAPLLNMTYKSVEMTRYRIRKKMGISRSDNLASLLDHISRESRLE